MKYWESKVDECDLELVRKYGSFSAENFQRANLLGKSRLILLYCLFVNTYLGFKQHVLGSPYKKSWIKFLMFLLDHGGILHTCQ